MAVALCALLPACALFGERAYHDHTTRSELSATTAAWLVAEVCRKELPAGDRLPMHGCPPILRTGVDSYTVRYLGDEGDGYRVERNGRITPPDNTVGWLRGCRFLADGEHTGNTASPRDEIEIEIHGDGAGGCTVRMRLAGTPAANGLARRLVLALNTGAVVTHVAHWIELGQLGPAEARAAAALREQDEQCHAHQQALVARLHYLRARIDLAAQDFAAARSHLRQAVQADGRLVVARRALARTCHRLADRTGVMAHGRGGDAIPTDDLERGAAELLAAGDPTAAGHWARKALIRAPQSREALRLLAESYAARGQPRRALETQLLALERFGFDADVVLGVAQRYASLGDDMTGVRFLARYGPQLELVQPRRAGKLLQRLCRNIPAGQAYRLLQRSGAALAREYRDHAGPACAELFSQISELRRTHGDTAGTPSVAARPAMDGYRMAPGVGPPR